MNFNRRSLLIGASAAALCARPALPFWHGQVGLQNHARWVLDGDSITASKSFSGWWVWGSLLSGGKLYIPPGGNTAVGGSVSAQVVARLSTDEAFNPAFYSIMIGTNNSLPIVPDLQTIYAGMIGVGSTVNAIPILPTTLGRGAYQLAANTYIRSLVGTQSYYITDFENVFDPSPSANPVQSADGLHPNCYGAYLIGNAWAQDVAPYLIGPSILPITTGNGNLCVNPLMTGTGGSGGGTGFSGTVADNWQVTWVPTGSMSCVASKDTLSTGQAAQALAISGAGSGLFELTSANITINGNIGDNFEAWCCVDWSGSGIYGASLRDVNNTVFNGGDSGSNAQSLFSPISGGVIRARPITLVATQTTIKAMIIGTVAAGASATLKFGQFMVRKVPAGQ